jgi:exodeoxyribonuclease III
LDGLERYVSAARARGRQLLLCGDLNIAREQQQFARMLEAGSLTDSSRKLAPDDDRLFSWWAPWRNLREKNVGWRIDYILTSEPLAAAALSCAVQRDFGKSGHGPLIAQFQLFGPTSQDDSLTRTSLAVDSTSAVP